MPPTIDEELADLVVGLGHDDARVATQPIELLLHRGRHAGAGPRGKPEHDAGDQPVGLHEVGRAGGLDRRIRTLPAIVGVHDPGAVEIREEARSCGVPVGSSTPTTV